MNASQRRKRQRLRARTVCHVCSALPARRSKHGPMVCARCWSAGVDDDEVVPVVVLDDEAFTTRLRRLRGQPPLPLDGMRWSDSSQFGRSRLFASVTERLRARAIEAFVDRAIRGGLRYPIGS